MNKEQLLHIIENPLSEISSENLSQIEDLLKTFPYFQGGHTLVARAFHQSGNVFADKKIRTAAVYSASRKKLKHFISASQPVVEKVKEITESKETQVSVIEKVEEKTKEVSKSLNKEVEEELEKLQQVKKEKPKNTSQEIKETLPPTPKTKPVVAKEKQTPKKTPIKKPVEAKKKEVKPTSKKQNLSSSRLGNAVYDINDQTQERNNENTPDILLEYLEYTRSKKRLKKPQKEQLHIIDSFIKTEPTISRTSPDKALKAPSSDLSQHSSIENTKLISENLALIYARQGNINKAVSIYEELILKNPLKKAYFASQIEKLKN